MTLLRPTRYSWFSTSSTSWQRARASLSTASKRTQSPESCCPTVFKLWPSKMKGWPSAASSQTYLVSRPPLTLLTAADVSTSATRLRSSQLTRRLGHRGSEQLQTLKRLRQNDRPKLKPSLTIQQQDRMISRSMQTSRTPSHSRTNRDAHSLSSHRRKVRFTWLLTLKQARERPTTSTSGTPSSSS